MIATIPMTWNRQELPIDIGIEKRKLADRIQAGDKLESGFGALYDSIAITASEDNQWSVLVSDYTEANQTNDGTIADFIELKPRWELLLPRSKQIQALNRPMVMGLAWDVVTVIAR